MKYSFFLQTWDVFSKQFTPFILNELTSYPINWNIHNNLLDFTPSSVWIDWSARYSWYSMESFLSSPSASNWDGHHAELLLSRDYTTWSTPRDHITRSTPRDHTTWSADILLTLEARVLSMPSVILKWRTIKFLVQDNQNGQLIILN